MDPLGQYRDLLRLHISCLNLSLFVLTVQQAAGQTQPAHLPGQAECRGQEVLRSHFS